MPSTYTNDLRLELIAVGEGAGSAPNDWGSKTNVNLTSIASAFGPGTENLSSDANATLTLADGAADELRAIYLKITSVSLTATRTITIAPNTVAKLWIIENATTGSQSITIKQGSGATVTIPNSSVKAIYTDGAGAGAAVVDALVDLDLTGTTTAGTITASGVVTGLTLEATGDTAAGDSAAIGYTAAEGLILTGQGSTNDVTVKNDADGDVIAIPTGGTDVNFHGNVNILAENDLRLQDASGGQYVALQAPATVASNVTLTLPADDGDADQVLSTNGSGVLDWVTSGGAYNAWLIKTSGYTALAGDQIIVNSASAVTITLPASASAGDTVIIKATGGGTVTVGRNSQNINSAAADATLFNGNAVQLVFVDATVGFLEI